MKTLKLLQTSNQLQVPAEIRSYDKNTMVVLVKDFLTAKVSVVELVSKDANNWESKDGAYTCNYSKDEFETGEEILVRVPKK